jgi:hypothetical protein
MSNIELRNEKKNKENLNNEKFLIELEKVIPTIKNETDIQKLFQPIDLFTEFMEGRISKKSYASKILEYYLNALYYDYHKEIGKARLCYYEIIAAYNTIFKLKFEVNSLHKIVLPEKIREICVKKLNALEKYRSWHYINIIDLEEKLNSIEEVEKLEKKIKQINITKHDINDFKYDLTKLIIKNIPVASYLLHIVNIIDKQLKKIRPIFFKH